MRVGGKPTGMGVLDCEGRCCDRQRSLRMDAIFAPSVRGEALLPEILIGPNPRRVAAGKRNRAKRKGLTPAGRQRLQEAALLHQPWLHSAGPRTSEGKAQAAQNG